MNVADYLNPGWFPHLVGALVVSVALGVAVLVAIGTAEVRSRHGEAQRVAAIRRTLLGERQPVGRGHGGRS
jgi:hypothetical protein